MRFRTRVPRATTQVLFSNIPGGGMSRSASLTLNLILSILDVNGTPADASVEGKMKIVDMAQVWRRRKSWTGECE